MTSLEKALRDFAQFAAKLKGDEKSEAQTFIFHLLAAFGHDTNTLLEGYTFEYRVRFSGERTKYADFVWPGRALIEMKSRGVKLSKHYQQTFDYWLNLPPHRLPNDVFALDTKLTEKETKRLANGDLLRDAEAQFSLPITTEQTGTEDMRQQPRQRSSNTASVTGICHSGTW